MNVLIIKIIVFISDLFLQRLLILGIKMKLSIKEQNDFIARFIEALKRDMDSSKHGIETNYRAIQLAIGMLSNRNLYPQQFDLLFIIRGALNFGALLEAKKYSHLFSQAGLDKIRSISKSWFPDLTLLEQLQRVNINDTTRVFSYASKGPLLVFPYCMSETRQVYLDLERALKNPNVSQIESPLSEHHPVNKSDVTNKSPIHIIPESQLSNVTIPDNTVYNVVLKITLKTAVTKAALNYLSYNENLSFSLFHHHGKAGRVRAIQFAQLLEKSDDLDIIKSELLSFLNNDKNGNTHPHSFRTMLMAELLQENDLKTISKQYNEKMADLTGALTGINSNPPVQTFQL